MQLTTISIRRLLSPLVCSFCWRSQQGPQARRRGRTSFSSWVTISVSPILAYTTKGSWRAERRTLTA